MDVLLQPSQQSYRHFVGVRLERQYWMDAAGARMNPRHVSVFFHDEKTYMCPDCNTEMQRAHVHGWFWYCAKCKQEHPLYKLQTHELNVPDNKKTFVDRARGFFGRKESQHG